MDGEDSGNQGSTVKKYPKLGDMTADEQDAYFAEGLDSEEVRKVQEDIKNSGLNAIPLRRVVRFIPKGSV